MEQLQAIADQLGINQSFIYQFIIVLVMFFVTKTVFYNVLQKVLDERVGKTTKLDGEADHLIAKAEKIESEVEEKLKDTNKESMEVLTTKKSEIAKVLDQKYKTEEAKVNKEVEEKTNAVLAEVEAQKAQVLGESKNLAESLVNKLV